MILSHETATKLDKAFFSVLLAGIIPPTGNNKAPNVYLSEMAVFYDMRNRRIKSSLGCPLFVDVGHIVKDLEQVPKRTISYGEEVSILLSGLKISSDKKPYCIYTKWEYRSGCLALYIIEESKFELTKELRITPEYVGYSYSELVHEIFPGSNTKGET